MDASALPAGFDLWPYLEPVINYVLLPALGVVGLWLVNRLSKWLGVEMTDRQRAAVTAATERVSAAVLRKYAPELRTHLTIPTDHPAVAEAAEYLQRRVPDALKRIGLKPEDVRDLVSTQLAAKLHVELPPPQPMTKAEILKQMVDLLQQYERTES